jgi:FAD binding domain
MNTGMQDVYNLGWKLGLVLNARCPGSLLESYHPERHQAGQDMLCLSDHLHRTLLREEPHLSLPETVRQKLAAVLAGQEVMQQRMRRAVAELNIGYRHSPIVAEHHRLLSGSRAAPPQDMISAPGRARETAPPMAGSCFILDANLFGSSEGCVEPRTT